MECGQRRLSDVMAMNKVNHCERQNKIPLLHRSSQHNTIGCHHSNINDIIAIPMTS